MEARPVLTASVFLALPLQACIIGQLGVSSLEIVAQTSISHCDSATSIISSCL